MLFSASATPSFTPSLCFLPPVMRLSGTAIRCSSAPLSASNFDLRTYWTTLITEINQKLDEAIPVKYPAGIYESMRYSVLAQGAKRAPPVMCVAACELLGGHRLAAFPPPVP